MQPLKEEKSQENVYREGFKDRMITRSLLEFELGEAVAEEAQLEQVGRLRQIQKRGKADEVSTDFRITSGIKPPFDPIDLLLNPANAIILTEILRPLD
jgi:hypothetical protein